MYFLGAVGSTGAKPPAFVYAIVPTLFVFFNIFASEHVPAIQKSRSLEELSVWGADVHRVEFVSQDAACLDDFLRDAGTYVNGI